MSTPPVDNSPAKSPPHYRLILIGTIVLTVAFGWVLWEQDVEYRVFPRNFGVVEAGVLYRCGRLSEEQSEPTMRRNNIQTVVSLVCDSDTPEEARPMAEAVEKLGLQRYIFSMSGNGTSTPEKYAQAVAAVYRSVQAGRPVLVHCVAGAQRTGGVIATFEMLVWGVSPEAALERMRAHGHDPSDNYELIPWLNENMPAIAAKLHEKGVIPAIPDPLPVLRP